MNEWKALYGRITLFPTMLPSSPPPLALELYRQIWHGEPDGFQKQANPLMPTIAQGRSGDLMINCMSQPARIDFNLMAAPSQVPQTMVALIDHPIQLRDELMRIINFLEESSVLNHVSRASLNLQFLNPKASHVEANKALTEIIPTQCGVTITDEEDFIFQINRPHVSRDFEDIRMNFITKWSVERLQVFTFSIPPGGVPGVAGIASPFSQAETFITASVLFDNNNTPTRTITGKEQSILLHEALDEAIRMQHESGLNIEGF